MTAVCMKDEATQFCRCFFYLPFFLFIHCIIVMICVTLHFHITDEDDLDGIPLVYDDYKRKKRGSSEEDSQSQDNGSEYSEDSRGFDRLQG